MTLTAKDVAKINGLYQQLERLQAERRNIKDATLEEARGHTKKGTSGIEKYEFGLGPEVAAEIKDILVRDIRKRAAKIVEQLHTYGCEAKLSEE